MASDSRSPRLPEAKAWTSSIDDRLSPSNSKALSGVAEQQAERFRRGQQDLRRPHPLARLAVGRRVAGPGLDPDVEPHLADRVEQVALDVDRERLERRDVERVQALCRGASISSASEAMNPARVLPAPVGATSRALRPARAAASISSWCRRGAQPLAANQSRDDRREARGGRAERGPAPGPSWIAAGGPQPSPSSSRRACFLLVIDVAGSPRSVRFRIGPVLAVAQAPPRAGRRPAATARRW